MVDTWKLMLSSRKFWTLVMTFVCVIAAVVLCALRVIPVEALTPTIIGLSGTGATLIASIAHEDAAASRAALGSPLQTVNVAATNPVVAATDEMSDTITPIVTTKDG